MCQEQAVKLELSAKDVDSAIVDILVRFKAFRSYVCGWTVWNWNLKLAWCQIGKFNCTHYSLGTLINEATLTVVKT